MTAGSVSLRSLLERPVMHNGIRLGDPHDAVLDTDTARVVGFEVDCADQARRFLPLAAARIRDDHLAIGSALLLLEADAREFYRRRSRPFSDLLGTAVERNGRRVGELDDLLVAADGTVEAVCARVNGSGVRLHARAEVTLSRVSGATAA